MKSIKSPKSSPSTKIFDGRGKANKLLSGLEKKIKKSKAGPGLAVISVGSDPASALFIKNKKRAAQKTGIKVFHYSFRINVKEKVILEKIKTLNADKSVNGIIVQLPLPGKLNADRIINQISLKKDIDGFRKKTHFSPPLISAIFIALKDSVKNLKGQKIVALVNSDFFGKALTSFLKKGKIKASYLKIEKRSKIKSGEEDKPSSSTLRYTRVADILITILGRPGTIKGEMIKDGAALIDAGITVRDNGQVIGDVDKESVKKKASFLTPVPGGIGPLTVALLLKNAYSASKKIP